MNSPDSLYLHSGLDVPLTMAFAVVSPHLLLLRSTSSRFWISFRTAYLKVSGTQVCNTDRAKPCIVPMYMSARPWIGPRSCSISSRVRFFSSAAAFSVKVNATTFSGRTPGRRRISTIRWEMTCVLPDPAHAMMSSGSSRVLIAARCAAV